MEVDISIIIPCFNHGDFIVDALNSFSEISGVSLEIIIVNDGSTDAHTIQVLSDLENQGFIIVNQKNLGLAAARNTGVLRSRGEYILPLDADNKVKPDYVLKALKILKNHQGDIVYGDPEFFGEMVPSRFFSPKDFDINEMILGNYIDACAVFRRSVWELIGGYDGNMPFPGHEDWEFWIHAYKIGFKFVHLSEKLYYYRISNNSMIVSTSIEDKGSFNHKYIVDKHFDLFLKLNYNHSKLRKIRKKELDNPFRSAFRFFLIGLRILKPKF